MLVKTHEVTSRGADASKGRIRAHFAISNPGDEDRGADLKWLGVTILGAAPLGFIPNLVLAQVLWGDAGAPSDLLFRAVPIWAAWLMLGVFPVMHGLTELPTYFGCVMPRLHTLTG